MRFAASLATFTWPCVNNNTLRNRTASKHPTWIARRKETDGCQPQSPNLQIDITVGPKKVDQADNTINLSISTISMHFGLDA